MYFYRRRSTQEQIKSMRRRAADCTVSYRRLSRTSPAGGLFSLRLPILEQNTLFISPAKNRTCSRQKFQTQSLFRTAIFPKKSKKNTDLQHSQIKNNGFILVNVFHCRSIGLANAIPVHSLYHKRQLIAFASII